LKEPANTLANLARARAVPPADFSDEPDRVIEVAHLPLNLPDPKTARDHLSSAGFYDPIALDELIASVTLGHVILAGPSGSGKTTLARALAGAFNAGLSCETANAEWSIFDTIGTQTLNETGGISPQHGVVTAAILRCANAIISHADTGSGFHAHWLLIDEMNRAEIDRAFGPLFTALSGGADPSMTLNYLKDRPSLSIPSRFRIIATINEYDTRFVQSMSAALRRRFSKVLVLPPPNEGGLIPSEEFDTALKRAMVVAVSSVGVALGSTESILRDNASTIRAIFGFFRDSGDHGGIPVGTASIIDVLSYFAVLAATTAVDAEKNFGSLLDRSISSRLVPMLETDSTRNRIDDNFPTALQAQFDELRLSSGRIAAFLNGLD
jgi:energy-coupling factor transporter ATP-binding protein EcfA2